MKGGPGDAGQLMRGGAATSAARIALTTIIALAWMPMTGGLAVAQSTPSSASTLSIRDHRGIWRPFWSAASAPTVWDTTPLRSAIQWKRGAAGIEWGEILLRGHGEAWRTRLVVARVDSRVVSFRLDTAFTANREANWSLALAPRGAVFAVNAGQFLATMPWGWVQLNGRRWLPPQHGPLSAALMEDSSGALVWIRGEEVTRAAATAGVRWAFQSYPAVIAADSLLPPLRPGATEIDVVHRDARLGICMARDGRILVALTRFAGAGRALQWVPFGLTVPEMAGVLGALGCRDAMLLDGGISARLRIRDARGRVHDWEGLRPVPLALIAMPRSR